MDIILNMIFIHIMEAILFRSTDFQTKLHLSSREPPRSGETRIERPWSTLSGLLGKLPILAGLPTVLFATTAMAATPNYVQGNYAVPQTPQTKVTVTYTTSQTAGDLSVVIVGWNDSTAQVSFGPNEGGNATPFSLLDGQLPFTGTVSVDGVTYLDISKPNPAYWAEIDSFIKLAGSYNLCAIPVATDTGNGQPNSCTLPTFRANGVAKCQAFGAFLGNRYKNFPNIIWQHGNDYNRTGNFNGQQPGDSHLMAAIINGIRSADNNHLHTLECDSGEPSPTCDLSSDDTTLYPLTDINEVYSYIPNYAPILLGYNLPSPKPVILGENGYEGQGLFGARRKKAGLVDSNVWCCRSILGNEQHECF